MHVMGKRYNKNNSPKLSGRSSSRIYPFISGVLMASHKFHKLTSYADRKEGGGCYSS